MQALTAAASAAPSPAANGVQPGSGSAEPPAGLAAPTARVQSAGFAARLAGALAARAAPANTALPPGADTAALETHSAGDVPDSVPLLPASGAAGSAPQLTSVTKSPTSALGAESNSQLQPAPAAASEAIRIAA
ncbi:MAG: hypothetical protein JO122_09685, partial [Acetobacteraceae bacterium]|nr:hypothetical protein [Acetobacteraceae bacterium]